MSRDLYGPCLADDVTDYGERDSNHVSTPLERAQMKATLALTVVYHLGKVKRPNIPFGISFKRAKHHMTYLLYCGVSNDLVTDAINKLKEYRDVYRTIHGHHPLHR